MVGKILLADTGVNNTLAHLTSASTFFAPSNDALLSYNKAADVNPAEGTGTPYELAGAQLLVVPGQFYTVSAYTRLT